MKFLNLRILIIFIVFSGKVDAQNFCKASKKHQFILEKSKILKNEYVSKIETFGTSQVYVNNYRYGENLKYKICNLKIENDSLIIEGYIKNNHNLLNENIFFLVGNKSDTVYTENLSTLGIQLYAGHKAIYLKDSEFHFLDNSELEILPKKIPFHYKFGIQNYSLFIISSNNFFTEIFDLKAIRENLKF